LKHESGGFGLLDLILSMQGFKKKKPQLKHYKKDKAEATQGDDIFGSQEDLRN